MPTKNAVKCSQGLNGRPLTFQEINLNGVSSFIIKSKNDIGQYKCYGLLLMTVFLNVVNVAYDFGVIIYSVIVYLAAAVYIVGKIQSVTKESLLVAPDFGYQVDTWGVFSHSSRFLPWHYVSGVFINEVIFRHKVIFVLTISTKDNKLIPLFQGSKPRLDLLEIIYKKIIKTPA